MEGFDVLLTELEFQKLSSIAKDHVRLYGHFDRDLGKHVLPSDDDRFSNHADDANTTFLGDHAIAIRDINPGEEITDNYRDYGKPLDFLQQGLP